MSDVLLTMTGLVVAGILAVALIMLGLLFLMVIVGIAMLIHDVWLAYRRGAR